MNASTPAPSTTWSLRSSDLRSVAMSGPLFRRHPPGERDHDGPVGPAQENTPDRPGLVVRGRRGRQGDEADDRERNRGGRHDDAGERQAVTALPGPTDLTAGDEAEDQPEWR